MALGLVAALPAAALRPHALLLAGLLAERSWLRIVLSTPLAQHLGRSSYFFYLLHISFLSVWWQPHVGLNRHVLLQFLVTVVLAEIGYRVLEEPLRRLVLRLGGEKVMG
ncbi:MAG: hypothetical protein ACRYFX_07190 [Janthinobacterium lividum]